MNASSSNVHVEEEAILRKNDNELLREVMRQVMKTAKHLTNETINRGNMRKRSVLLGRHWPKIKEKR